MINTLNKDIVNDTFNRKYDEVRFIKFIKDLLPEADFSPEKAKKIPIRSDGNRFDGFIRSAKHLQV